MTVTNSLALLAVHNLNRNQASLQQSLQRLSTGYRINSAADDPAGLIASEMLRGEIAATNAQIGNAQRSDSVLATAEAGMGEISNLLVSLQSLVVASANQAGLSSDEVDANQLQVDSILSSINRISNSTTFGGRQLLDGQMAYHVQAGANAAALHNVNIQSSQLQPGPVNVQVMTSAQHASLIYHGTPQGLNGPLTLNIAGNQGQMTYSFASSTSAATIAQTINQLSNSTGVMASASGADVTFISTGYGSSQFVSVSGNSGNFQTQSPAGFGANRATGRDAIVAVNGNALVAHGLTVQGAANGLATSLTLDPSYNYAGMTAQFSITGGGATFALGGAAGSAADSIGIPGMQADAIGFTQDNAGSYSLEDLKSGGKASLKSGNLTVAQDIVSSAIKEVAQSRGQIGAQRQYDIGSQINLLNIKLENLSSAESSIRDTDFATESANLARSQILM